MGRQAELRQAFIDRSRLMSAAMAVPISIWDAEFEVPDSGIYIECKLFPAPPVDLHLGDDEDVQHEGFYQLTLVYPLNSGEVAVAEMVDAMMQWFKKGRNIPCGNYVIELYRAPVASPLGRDEPGTRNPVTIYYRMFAPQV